MDRFQQDLSRFLRLETPLGPMPTGTPPNSRKMEIMLNNTAGIKQIDICDREHEKVRKVLMTIARDASQWIRRYFVHSPTVKVSSPQYFTELLKAWEKDPCTTTKLSTGARESAKTKIVKRH